MNARLFSLGIGVLFLLGSVPALRADVLEMQNGDRYSGKVLSMSASVVVLNSEILGKINVPRNKLARLTFGTNALPQEAASPSPAASANLPAVSNQAPLTGTNADLSAALRQLGANTNFISQIRQQILAGNPGAESKYDEMVNGLLSGQLNVNDLRRQAQQSASQLRELKRQLGPEADESLDAYLKVLDAFVNEAGSEPPK